MTTPIDSLEPKERALLYTAMLFFKDQTEMNLSQAIHEDYPTALKEFYKYTEAETNILMQKIFGEYFPEDLEFVKHFNAFWKDQHNLVGKEISTAIEQIQAIAD